MGQIKLSRGPQKLCQRHNVGQLKLSHIRWGTAWVTPGAAAVGKLEQRLFGVTPTLILVPTYIIMLVSSQAEGPLGVHLVVTCKIQNIFQEGLSDLSG